MVKITAMEQKRKRLGLNVSKFYAAPRKPPSDSALPIFDKSHARNAMARFNQTDFKNKLEKVRAYLKIRRAARRFKIDVDEFKGRKP